MSVDVPRPDHAPQLSVVVPCFNEEGNVAELVRRTRNALEAAGITFEVVLVDDRSTDDTWAAIKEAETQHGRLVVGLQHSVNQGMFAAWRTGMAAASGDVACLIDADLQNPPEALPRLWEELHSRPTHLVQGFRSSIEWSRDSRYVSSRGLNVILNTAFRDRARDNKSGFVMAPREILTDVLSFTKEYKYPQSFIRVAAHAKGYSVAEVETLFQPRRVGTSFLDGRPPVQLYADVLSDVVRAVGEFGRGRRHPVEALYAEPVAADQPSHGYTGARKALLDGYFATMPLHAWLIRPQTKSVYETLHRTQWLSPAELSELQNWRLQRLVWHAYADVPYYRRIFTDHGLHPRDITSVEDLAGCRCWTRPTSAPTSTSTCSPTTTTRARCTASRRAGRPASRSSPTPTDSSSRSAGRRRCARWSGPGWRIGDQQVRLWHQTIGMSRVQVVRERARRDAPATDLHPRLRDDRRGTRGPRPAAQPAPAGAHRRLRRVAQLPRPVPPRQRGKLDVEPRAMISSAQMLPARAAPDRGGLRLPGLRQVRRAASSRASPTSAGTRRSPRASTRATSSRS